MGVRCAPPLTARWRRRGEGEGEGQRGRSTLSRARPRPLWRHDRPARAPALASTDCRAPNGRARAIDRPGDREPRGGRGKGEKRFFAPPLALSLLSFRPRARKTLRRKARTAAYYGRSGRDRPIALEWGRKRD